MSDGPLPPDWAATIDPSSGNMYYYNFESRKFRCLDDLVDTPTKEAASTEKFESLIRLINKASARRPEPPARRETRCDRGERCVCGARGARVPAPVRHP